jgi:hypothetical protein
MVIVVAGLLAAPVPAGIVITVLPPTTAESTTISCDVRP